ncbi:MAG: putative spermidine/putrescine transport system ATP-binding protein [Solirubrobacteraceae bacterium]|nr:putative spermidine/putrescine transport system ATP-binding protein [Solirubrobacteraceae bacterium]
MDATLTGEKEKDAELTRSGRGPADVHLVGVVKQYGDVAAVDEVDLEIERGEFFTLLGPSGSGKTTCLRLIAGFERPDAGRIMLGGRDVTGLPPAERDVNTVFQDYALFAHMTVAANVAYGLRVKRVPRTERDERVKEALAMVRLEGYGDRRPSQLSGGQRQRVALARALVNRPRVLLLDEPLGALDLKLRQQLQVELKRIQQEVGITFVYVTHDQEEALTMSDRIAVVDQGRIVQIGSPRAVYERPDSSFVAGFVGVSNLLELPVAHVAGDSVHLRLADGDAVVAPAGPGATPGAIAVVTVRPERIALTDPKERVPRGACHARGRVRESLYAGPATRFVVDLDGGGELLVVRQNGATSFEDAEALKGRPVVLVWERESTRVIAYSEETTK